jgi:hypothetical protein
MNPRSREKFFTWYNDLVNKEYVFDFQAEILSYCQSDVEFLRRCCLEFRELFSQITDVDPFASCLTIASACNPVFRKTFLQENTIAVILPYEYKPENKQSDIALKMLAWSLNAIISLFATPAIKANNVLVSTSSMGLMPNSTLTFGRSRDACAMAVYARSSTTNTGKKRFLEDAGYNAVQIRTCDIERQLAIEPEMKDFLDNFEISEPLEPRHAFFGGRTNATRFFYETQPGE